MRSVIENLIGKECWGVIAGKGTGSRSDLLIGSKIKRNKSSSNTSLSEDEREYDGEYSIFIQNCSWRLASAEDGLICTSKSENAANGEMINGLWQLRQQRVTATSLDALTLDLSLSFENGLVLMLFCDCMDDEWDGDNYSVSHQSRVYTVGVKSKLLMEAR